MERETLNKYKKAQSIADSVILSIRPTIKEGVKLIDIGDTVENKIRNLGGGIAFPVNLSINDNAAHYAPDINDDTILKENDMIKIDVGVHVDGYICDQAFTVCIGKKSHPLIEAAEKGLKEAKKIIKPGVRIFEISEVVESTLKELGCNPIRNLCGHGLDRYEPHAKFSIPNGRNDIKTELESGQALAMEVFATDGVGWVRDSGNVLIYAYNQETPMRMNEARKILDLARNEYNGLPFAKRWLINTEIPLYKVNLALNQLMMSKALKEHPILREESGGIVAQAEETIIL